MYPSEIFEGTVRYALKELSKWLRNAKISDSGLELICKNPDYEDLINHENKAIKGALIYINGEDVKTKLEKGDVVCDTQLPEYQNIGNLDDFLNRMIGIDGAIIINGKQNKYTTARALNPDPNEEKVDLEYFISYDFDKHEKQSFDTKPGTRTTAGIIPPLNHEDVTTILMRETCYSNAGMGIIAQFGADGLEKTVHFEYRPNLIKANVKIEDEEFKKSIVMVYREYYRNSDNEIVCNESKTRIINPAELYGDGLIKYENDSLEKILEPVKISA